ncbi:hypothetical protein Clacol_007395 [Clathrus columnatus]|uniref:Uncharacterized protein n=1 Tax=Clathrus columnatus TaxID=1419009 RepID=A0AAV5AJ39_9AGAM|nr:hypothetical protein Clacol_007395 [Clathrus columnatus]
MSLPHPSQKAPFSPKHVRNSSSVHQKEFSIEGVFKNITSSLELLDFNEFFKKFDLDSPICKFMEAFSTAELRELIMQAFAETDGLAHDSSTVKAVRRAKRVLDDELGNLDAMFKIIEASNLNIGTVRTSLGWLREANRRSLERLESLKHSYSENPRTFKQPHYPSVIPNIPIPVSMNAWQQQQQRYRDAYLALFKDSRPFQDSRSLNKYASPLKHTGYHPSSHPPLGPTHLRSPTRVSFSSKKPPTKHEEPDVPFIPPPLPTSPPSLPALKKDKGKKS